MKKSYLLLLISFLLLPLSFSYGQFFIEDFDYPAGDTLISHGWSQTGTVTTNPILVTSPGLTYAGYAGSGIGNSVTLLTSGQDANVQFTPITSGAIYASLMVNIASAQTGDYFFHLGLANTTSIYMGRVFIKVAANGNLRFGLSKSSTSTTVQPVYGDSIYITGTTYLLVLKYQFNPDVTDDSVYLFINPAISPIEPLPDLAHGTLTTGNDPANIGGVYIRQGSSSSAANLTLDGIRIGTAWADVVPVELTSFTANVSDNDVILSWSTASELNNAGFEVQRLIEGNEFATIGFIEGHGTTTEAKTYRFVDADLLAGSYTYRLKQVDFNGTFAYSDEVNAEITSPVQFELAQNYPNPFNPSTTIKFSIPQSSNVTLKVFNALGQEVSTLVDQIMEAGSHTINFDATQLNSGIYFYRIEAGMFNEVRKMTLIK
ncbi:MAG: T9SS type A sorting domain-containing protein [bacterium]|nr:T9SS type A sorting domain-containing protein [bacterium]